MGAHAPRELELCHLSPCPLRRARRAPDEPHLAAAGPGGGQVAGRRAHARHAGDGQARAAPAASDEDRHADEHDESRESAQAPAQPVARSHGIGRRMVNGSFASTSSTYVRGRPNLVTATPSNPRSPLKLRDSHAAAVTQLLPHANERLQTTRVATALDEQHVPLTAPAQLALLGRAPPSRDPRSVAALREIRHSRMRRKQAPAARPQRLLRFVHSGREPTATGDRRFRPIGAARQAVDEGAHAAELIDEQKRLADARHAGLLPATPGLRD